MTCTDHFGASASLYGDPFAGCTTIRLSVSSVTLPRMLTGAPGTAAAARIKSQIAGFMSGHPDAVDGISVEALVAGLGDHPGRSDPEAAFRTRGCDPGLNGER